MRKYWFYVEPFVVINVGRQDSVLFYSTLNGFSYISSDNDVVEIGNKLSDMNEEIRLEKLIELTTSGSFQFLK